MLTFLVTHENTKNTQMYCGLWRVRIQIGCTVNLRILNVQITRISKILCKSFKVIFPGPCPNCPGTVAASESGRSLILSGRFDSKIGCFRTNIGHFYPNFGSFGPTSAVFRQTQLSAQP